MKIDGSLYWGVKYEVGVKVGGNVSWGVGNGVGAKIGRGISGKVGSDIDSVVEIYVGTGIYIDSGDEFLGCYGEEF